MGLAAKALFSWLMIFCMFFAGCQSPVRDSAPQPAPSPAAAPSPPPAASEARPSVGKIDVPLLANKPPADLDKVYGPPEDVTPATIPSEKPGEYRLYKVNGNSKGLSVRFYKGKVVRFNLFLEQPANSAKEALLQAFNIDIKDSKPYEIKDLSERYRGIFGGARFQTAYAKRGKEKGGFVMVHAEAAP